MISDPYEVELSRLRIETCQILPRRARHKVDLPYDAGGNGSSDVAVRQRRRSHSARTVNAHAVSDARICLSGGARMRCVCRDGLGHKIG